jgi:hypothetical protein
LGLLHLMKLKLAQLDELKLEHCGLTEHSALQLLTRAINLRVLVIAAENISCSMISVALTKLIQLEELKLKGSFFVSVIVISGSCFAFTKFNADNTVAEVSAL